MGWLVSHDMTKAEQVADLMKGWSTDEGGCRFLAHSVRGNVLYAVGQNFTRTKPESFDDRFIIVILLRKDRGYGWGYKDMSEAMGPYKYDCPLKFLKMAPVADENWREKVLAHHAHKRKNSTKIEQGMNFRFANGYKDSAGGSLDGVEAVIVRKSGRCYIAELGFATIRIQRRHIGEIIA